MIGGLITWLLRKREKRVETLLFERRVTVSIDDTGLSTVYPDGSTQTIPWAKVERIVIEANDSGPWGADVWWMLESEGGCCAYPQGSTGDGEALDQFQKRFSGFNSEAVIGAMGCTANARFVCWERENPV